MNPKLCASQPIQLPGYAPVRRLWQRSLSRSHSWCHQFQD